MTPERDELRRSAAAERENREHYQAMTDMNALRESAEAHVATLRAALVKAVTVAREMKHHYGDAVDDPETCEEAELALRSCQNALAAPPAQSLARVEALVSAVGELLEAIGEHTPFPDRQRAAEEAVRTALAAWRGKPVETPRAALEQLMREVAADDEDTTARKEPSDGR